MQVTELKNEGLDFEVKVVLPSSKISDEVKKELANLAKTVKLDGFRAGHVPANIIVKKYGSSVRSDIVQKEISHAVQHVLKEHKIKPFGEPRLEDLRNEENKDLEFILKFELLPDVKVPDLKHISITRPKLLIQDDDVDKQVDKLAAMSKQYTKETSGKIKTDQQVTIDAVGYADGKAFDGGKITDHKLVIGSKAFIAGFEDQLIGAKVGDEVEVNVTFPENYHAKHLANKPAKFIVHVKAVHSAEKSVVNDDFAKQFKCETLKELRDNISKSMADEFKEPINNLMKMKLFDQLEPLLTFDVPQSLITQEVNILKSQTAEDNDTDEMFKNKSQKEINTYYQKLALRRVKIGLLLSEYMTSKNLRIDQNDIKDAVITQARRFPGQEREIFDFYQNNPRALDQLKGPLLEEKTVRHIFDNAVKVKDKDYTREKLEALFEQEEERIE